MSVSDPLLKELKGHVFDLRRHSLALAIDDSNGLLQPFCITLEKILRKGLVAQTSTALGCIHRDYWDCFLSLLHLKEKAGLSLQLRGAIQTVSEFKKVRTTQGRGRLLLRVLLKKKLTRAALERLIGCKELIQGMYCPMKSILGNEILAEILLSLLYEVDKVSFNIVLRNASFLDVTWHLGMYRAYEFVPCTNLGLSVGFSGGHAVVTRVREGSVAAEDDQVEVGDVLDELYGEPLKGRKRGTMSALLAHFEGLPVYVSIVKSYQRDKSVYPPLSGLLRHLGLSSPPSNCSPSSQEDLVKKDLLPWSESAASLLPQLAPGLPINTPLESSAYPAVYLGKSYVGNVRPHLSLSLFLKCYRLSGLLLSKLGERRWERSFLC